MLLAMFVTVISLSMVISNIAIATERAESHQWDHWEEIEVGYRNY